VVRAITGKLDDSLNHHLLAVSEAVTRGDWPPAADRTVTAITQRVSDLQVSCDGRAAVVAGDWVMVRRGRQWMRPRQGGINR
jgi:hypothetical protein